MTVDQTIQLWNFPGTDDQSESLLGVGGLVVAKME